MRMIHAGVLLVLSPLGLAEESPDLPLVRLEMQPESVTVGEAAQLRVTVLGPTWFPQPPVFPSFEVPNAIVRLPPDSSGPTSAQVNGERWSGVTRSYQVFPLVGATFRLGGGTMLVTVANPGSEPLVADIAVPEVTLVAGVPAEGAGLDPYIAGTQFRLWREIDGDPEDLQPGDALVVRYFAELDGMPAIFLPPLAPRIDSPVLSVYLDEPVLSEGAVSKRSERMTLVMNYGGDFTLPAVSLRWWNKTTNQVQLVSIEEMSLLIDGPAPEADEPQVDKAGNWRRLILALLLLSASIYLSLRYLPILRRWLKGERARYLGSEKSAFNQLRKACQKGDNRVVYAALLAWQQKLCSDLPLRQFARSYGGRSLPGCVEALSEVLYAGSGVDFSASELLRSSSAARDRFLTEKNQAQQRLIPDLNPG